MSEEYNIGVRIHPGKWPFRTAYVDYIYISPSHISTVFYSDHNVGGITPPFVICGHVSLPPLSPLPVPWTFVIVDSHYTPQINIIVSGIHQSSIYDYYTVPILTTQSTAYYLPTDIHCQCLTLEMVHRMTSYCSLIFRS